MEYDHRTNDPDVTFTYDDLDRLTGAIYNMDAANKTDTFSIDDLGNRTGTQTLRGGTTESYTVDDETNRYTHIAGNGLTYDSAGNIITDKDPSPKTKK